MNACAATSATSLNSVGGALRTVDCRAADAIGAAFARLFGSDGVLLPALTILLTLYVAFIAIGLLTGRTKLNLASLTPRMMALGMVLTFATSWVAYQNVVWNLASGAPDEIATLLMGTRGSATMLFADRLDIIFNAIAKAAAELQAQTGDKAPTSMSPTDLIWLSALLMLLGTVGVLLTTRIALAAMLALGPVFIVLALFKGTRGLFEGWVKAVVMFAVAPLFTVLIGGGALELTAPFVKQLRDPQGGASMEAATGLFVAAVVYVALMLMVLKTTGTMVAGWRIFGANEPSGNIDATQVAAIAAAQAPAAAASAAIQNDRVRSLVSAIPAAANGGGTVAAAISREVRVTTNSIAATSPPDAIRNDQRVRGIGSRFRTAPNTLPNSSTPKLGLS